MKRLNLTNYLTKERKDDEEKKKTARSRSRKRKRKRDEKEREEGEKTKPQTVRGEEEPSSSSFDITTKNN